MPVKLPQHRLPTATSHPAVTAQSRFRGWNTHSIDFSECGFGPHLAWIARDQQLAEAVTYRLIISARQIAGLRRMAFQLSGPDHRNAKQSSRIAGISSPSPIRCIRPQLVVRPFCRRMRSANSCSKNATTSSVTHAANWLALRLESWGLKCWSVIMPMLTVASLPSSRMVTSPTDG